MVGRRVCIVLEVESGGRFGRRSASGFSLLRSAFERTVEAVIEVDAGSSTDGNARSSGVLYLATGGLPCNGLTCRVRAVVLDEITTPGE